MIDIIFPNGIDHYLIGGLLVGAGIGLVYILTGRVAGASTVFTSTWSYVHSGTFFQDFTGSRSWRLTLAIGLVLGGFLYYLTVADGVATVTSLSPLRMFIAGILVGIGSRMAGGCASGHGICGNAFAERNSIIATITFLIVGVATALITTQLL